MTGYSLVSLGLALLWFVLVVAARIIPAHYGSTVPEMIMHAKSDTREYITTNCP